MQLEPESSACAKSSQGYPQPINLEKDEHFHSETSSNDGFVSEIRTDYEIRMLSSSARASGTALEGSSLPIPTSTSSNDEQQEQREAELIHDEEEDPHTLQSDRDLETGSYTISIVFVAGGDKLCHVNPPRFSLIVAFAFVIGTFLLVFWLTESGA